MVMSESFSFCPICQLPLKAISISPDLHVFQCMTKCEENVNAECPKGVDCLSTDVFHYRDFNHKLLAAYRSSANFVPPDVEIKPSPKKHKTPTNPKKRSSPRKTRSSSKSNEDLFTCSSDSESEILIQPKRPRRNLKFNEEDCSVSAPQNNKIKATSKKALQLSKSKVQNNLVSEKGISKKICNGKTSINSNSSVIKDEIQIKKENLEGKIAAILNVKLNAGEEVRLINSRSQSPSSLSVSTNDSKSDSETTADSSVSKITRPVPEFNLKDKVIETSKSNFALKEPVLELPKLNNLLLSSPQTSSSDDLPLVKIAKSDEENNSIAASETNVSLSKADFEDIIPISTLDKEMLKIVETDKVGSPTSTAHSCSEFTVGTDSLVSDTEYKESVLSDSPSSPEVTIPRVTPRRKTTFLSSSSDSDLPLASLIHNKEKLNSNKSNETRSKTRGGKVFQKESNNHIIKGKEKAGKVLRSPNKAPVYLNGSSVKSHSVNAGSDKDSDSGKSSGSKDASYVPSERSESHHSDSAFSAESTDKMTSSVSSSYTSSEENTNESRRSSDPSYFEESESYISPKFNAKSPRKHKHVSKHLSLDSESSLSEISRREKLFFGGKLKSSPKLKNITKPKEMKNRILSIGLQESTDSDYKSEWQSLLNKMRSSSFPSDLKIDSEDSLTVASSCSSSDTSHTSTVLLPRQCPFYKRIPDTPFAVDAFQYWNIPGVKIYFLSHFHSDHYTGLRKNFSHPIYCSKITANLVRMKLRIDEKLLHILELNEPQIIHGVEVTALEANHCPGSLMLLFSLTNGRNYLHVGDFRASKNMAAHPCLQKRFISKLFLDTTYCSPQYCFPTQEEVIEKVIDIVKAKVKIHPRTLVVCGSYTIGKEKMFLGVAEALDWRVWARPEKQRVFTCLDDKRINSRLVKDPRSANIHVLPMASIQIMSLQQHLQSCSGAFTHVIGVKPTGWELNSSSQNFKVTSRDNITVYGVPYSEHSSFSELRDFVQFLQPQEVVPTVNVGNPASRSKMSKYFSEWLSSSSSSDTQTKVSQYFKRSGS